MDLSNGPRLGIFGSLLMLLSMVLMLAIGLFITVTVLAAVYPSAVGANGLGSNSINGTQVVQQAQNAATTVLGQFLVPIIADLLIEIAGVVLLALSFSAFGKEYKDEKTVRYGYYGSVCIIVALVIELIGPASLSIVAFVLMLVGFLFYMMVLGYISKAASANKLRYYGYGLALGAVLNLINPLGTVVFIVVFALMALGFRNISKSGGIRGRPSPFDTARITSDASLKKRKGKK
jgi:hypothetical protein